MLGRGERLPHSHTPYKEQRWDLNSIRPDSRVHTLSDRNTDVQTS